MNHILVIDRDESFKRQVRKVFEGKGFAVVELRAGSAQDAGIRCGDRLALDTVAR